RRGLQLQRAKETGSKLVTSRGYRDLYRVGPVDRVRAFRHFGDGAGKGLAGIRFDRNSSLIPFLKDHPVAIRHAKTYYPIILFRTIEQENILSDRGYLAL